jgi:hypothetical protein
MAAEAMREDLVYVSDAADNSVTAYSFKARKLVGKLTGISQPYGVCSDTSGNVWVVAWGNNKLIEYAHGGTKPLRILTVNDWSADLYACSVDPTTGNLAVTNWGAENWYQGNVLIYPRGSSWPTAYSNPRIWFYYGCSYDQYGNLYVDGWDAYRNYYHALGELSKGSKDMRVITLIPNFAPPLIGGIQWDGKYVAVGDFLDVYEFVIKGKYAYVAGDTPLTSYFPVGLFWITTVGGKPQILAPDQAGHPSAVQYWNYPAGGTPIGTITNGLQHAFGVTVSVAPKR